ncbi:MAG: ACP S-malonyltransferase [Chlamydiota bacterium]
MNKKWAFLFPGQGAQYVGMGKDFYEQFSSAREVFDLADEFLKRPFSQLIFNGPQEELTLTKNSQLAIFITSFAILSVVREQFPDLRPQITAGLSLGEYTALTAAEKMEFLECLDLVRTRGEAMHAACEETKGSMQVVLGMAPEAVQAVIDAHAMNDVCVANLNCPGQVVIPGTYEALAAAADALKAGGAKRVLPLDVAGAFHSKLMRSAQEKLAAKIKDVPFQQSPIDVVMNVPGDLVFSEEVMRRVLIDQVSSPVLWEKGIRKMVELDVDAYLEMGPGKTLAGMNKRIGVAQPICSIEKVSDLEELRKVIETVEAYAAIES